MLKVVMFLVFLMLFSINVNALYDSQGYEPYTNNDYQPTWDCGIGFTPKTNYVINQWFFCNDDYCLNPPNVSYLYNGSRSLIDSFNVSYNSSLGYYYSNVNKPVYYNNNYYGQIDLGGIQQYQCMYYFDGNTLYPVSSNYTTYNYASEDVTGSYATYNNFAEGVEYFDITLTNKTDFPFHNSTFQDIEYIGSRFYFDSDLRLLLINISNISESEFCRIYNVSGGIILDDVPIINNYCYVDIELQKGNYNIKTFKSNISVLRNVSQGVNTYNDSIIYLLGGNDGDGVDTLASFEIEGIEYILINYTPSVLLNPFVELNNLDGDIINHLDVSFNFSVYNSTDFTLFIDDNPVFNGSDNYEVFYNVSLGLGFHDYYVYAVNGIYSFNSSLRNFTLYNFSPDYFGFNFSLNTFDSGDVIEIGSFFSVFNDLDLIIVNITNNSVFENCKLYLNDSLVFITEPYNNQYCIFNYSLKKGNEYGLGFNFSQSYYYNGLPYVTDYFNFTDSYISDLNNRESVVFYGIEFLGIDNIFEEPSSFIYINYPDNQIFSSNYIQFSFTSYNISDYVFYLNNISYFNGSGNYTHLVNKTLSNGDYEYFIYGYNDFNNFTTDIFNFSVNYSVLPSENVSTIVISEYFDDLSKAERIELEVLKRNLGWFSAIVFKIRVYLGLERV